MFRTWLLPLMFLGAAVVTQFTRPFEELFDAACSAIGWNRTAVAIHLEVDPAQLTRWLNGTNGNFPAPLLLKMPIKFWIAFILKVAPYRGFVAVVRESHAELREAAHEAMTALAALLASSQKDSEE